MEPDEQTNAVLNQVDAFRTNWISVNEKLREANTKIESLEAELSTLKNQLYYSTCEREILNHTLNELRKTLRADCKVIDQIQRNKSSFIRLAHEYDEQTAPRNPNISTPVDETRATITLSEHGDQDIPSFVNNSPSQPTQTRPKPNTIKKLLKLPSAISTRRTTSLPTNVSDPVPIQSQNKSASEILREKTSRANLRSRKIIEFPSKIFSRGHNKILGDLNGDASEVVVIDYEDETEDSSKSVRPTDDVYISSEEVYIEDDDSDLISNSSSSGSKNTNLENEVDPNESSNDRADSQQQTDLVSTVRPEDNEEIALTSSTQNLINLNSNQQAGSISASRGQGGENTLYPDDQSSIGLNSNKSVDLIRPPTFHVQGELNFSISNGIKSVPTSSEIKSPIVLLSPLGISNGIPQSKNNQSRKRKKPAVVKPEEYDRKSIEKIKKSRPPSSMVLEPHLQNAISSPSSSKTASKVSRKTSKKSTVQKKKKPSFPTRTYICKMCNEIFNCAKALSRHLNNIHVGDGRTWTCPTCGFITQSRPSFAAHVAQHKEEKCVICEKENRQDILQYPKKSDLDLHILENHPNPYPDYIPCPYKNGECKEFFSTTKIYDKHVNTIHKDEDLSLPREKIFPGQDFWTCSACGKIFTQASHISKHADQAHTRDQKVFSCEFCGFKTSQLKSLRKHSKTLCFEKNKNIK